jgi:nicotinamide riboside transporter PnuC
MKILEILGMVIMVIGGVLFIYALFNKKMRTTNKGLIKNIIFLVVGFGIMFLGSILKYIGE